MAHPPHPIVAVEIPTDSDDDVEDSRLSPLFKRRALGSTNEGCGGSGREVSSPPRPPLPPFSGPEVFILDEDDPTPIKKPSSSSLELDRFTSATPLFVPETPLPPGPIESGTDFSIVRCTFDRSRHGPPLELPLDKFSGVSGFICLESDDEEPERECTKVSVSEVGGSGYGFLDKVHFPNENGTFGSKQSSGEAPGRSMFENHGSGIAIENSINTRAEAEGGDSWSYWSKDQSLACANDVAKKIGESCLRGSCSDEDMNLLDRSGCEYDNITLEQADVAPKKRGRRKKLNNDIDKGDELANKKQSKEEKARLKEEQKWKKQEEKAQREALKAEAAEMKKMQKEKKKWEQGKFALKSIVAEIDTKVVESGAVGGHLLSRLAEKGISFRITRNPFERSVLWKMTIPDQISQLSTTGSEVPYVLFVYEAEEFCNMVLNECLLEHVHNVQKRHASFTVCYLTNKLMSYINKRDQNQYKNPSNANCWKRPPVEEVLSKLTTHFTRVHSRQCMDEADVAEHIVGLSSSLATCHFRKRLTWLSINANGSLVPNGFIDKHLIRRSGWLKALTAIPKVQPRYAMAIWKKYPTMRSLLNVYLDPNKSVLEKEFLLKDLPVEGPLGKEDKRLGEACSKRIYRILMARNGSSKTDDVEDGADFFTT